MWTHVLLASVFASAAGTLCEFVGTGCVVEETADESSLLAMRTFRSHQPASGDDVECPGTPGRMCAGNQCCPPTDKGGEGVPVNHTFPCPTAELDWDDCESQYHLKEPFVGSPSRSIPFKPLLGDPGDTSPWICEGEAFFDCFSFYHGADPTHGYTDYIGRTEAMSSHLAGVTGSGSVFMASSTGSNSGPIKTIRLHGRRTFNSGLFILDIVHLPTGAGTWPAWWMYGPNWPNTGEFDMIETVNSEPWIKTSIHTSCGCNMPSVPGIDAGGKGCNGPSNNPGQDGAGVAAPPGGQALNAQGGGFYAVHWTSRGFDMYIFPRDSAPADITSNSPKPSTWGAPWRTFPFGKDCPSTHFQQMMPTFDLTFCGDWAGNVAPFYSPQRCNAHVASTANPEAYWEINSMKVYQAA